MAVTMILEEKIDRVTLVKIAASHHGWLLRSVMNANQAQNIEEADISIYVIDVLIDKKPFMITYQPKMDELTIMGSETKQEQENKQQILDIIAKRKIGDIAREQIPLYHQRLAQSSLFLTSEELNQSINESNIMNAINPQYYIQ